jgi:hypothetical protein
VSAEPDSVEGESLEPDSTELSLEPDSTELSLVET